MHRSLVVVITAMGLALAAPAGAAVGVSGSVRCGDTLTTDTVLTHDLTCPEGNGLTLDAGVVLDLGGHRLVGPGGAGQAVTFDGSEPATVTHGTIQAWQTGVTSGETGALSTHTLRAVTFIENGTAAESFLTGGYVVESARFLRNGVDINAFRSAPGWRVTGSTFTDGGGVSLVGSAVEISGSRFAGTGVRCTDGTLRITLSTFRGAEQAVAHGDCGGTVTSSWFFRNQTAYSVESSDSATPNQVTGNTFLDNQDAVVARGAGVDLRLNSFISNDRAVYAPAPPDEDPFWVAHLERNVLLRNGDAIYSEIPGTLRGNVAIGNTGYGIYAPRATDLGGNIAFHNGVEPQCTGVVCSRR